MLDVKKSKDFERMMLEGLQEGCIFFAWQSIGGLVEKCELKLKAYRKEYNELEFELEKNESVDKIAKVISGDRVLNMYSPELSVSFSSELKLISVDKKIKLYFPKDFSFYERRKHERVQPIKTTCFVCFEHNKKLFKKSLFDVSLGGIAVILPKSDKCIINKGKIFDSLVLEIGARKIKVKAECINTIVIDRFKFDYLPYGGFKLAFRFIELGKADKAFLTEFIAHEKLMQQVQKKAVIG